MLTEMRQGLAVFPEGLHENGMKFNHKFYRFIEVRIEKNDKYFLVWPAKPTCTF